MVILTKTYNEIIDNESLMKNFINKTIAIWLESVERKDMITNQKYADGNNEKINKLKFYYRADETGDLIEDIWRANNKITCDFFNKIVTQKVSYLLSNGLGVETENKDEEKVLSEIFDDKFNYQLFKAGIEASIKREAYSYVYTDETNKVQIVTFNTEDCIAMYLFETSELAFLIRTWDSVVFNGEANETIRNVEIYTQKGIIFYNGKPGDVEFKARKAYFVNDLTYGDYVASTSEENWKIDETENMLPILYLKNTQTVESDLRPSLKSKIDAYDSVVSGFLNNIEDNAELFWVLKNYTAEDLTKWYENLKQRRVVKTGEDGDATPHQINIPVEARDKLLDVLKKDIYRDAMALDTDEMAGGSLTNVVVKARMADLDLKTDQFEWEIVNYLEGIIPFINFIHSKDFDPTFLFIRRTLVNDGELIDNIVKFRPDISQWDALALNPLIPQNKIDEFIKRYKAEQALLDSIDVEDEIDPEANKQPDKNKKN